jgi:hypothetical protein
VDCTNGASLGGAARHKQRPLRLDLLVFTQVHHFCCMDVLAWLMALEGDGLGLRRTVLFEDHVLILLRVVSVTVLCLTHI